MYTEGQVRHFLGDDHQPPDRNTKLALFTKYEEILSAKRQDILSSEGVSLRSVQSTVSYPVTSLRTTYHDIFSVKPRSKVELHMRRAKLQSELILTGKARPLGEKSNLIRI